MHITCVCKSAVAPATNCSLVCREIHIDTRRMFSFLWWLVSMWIVKQRCDG